MDAASSHLDDDLPLLILHGISAHRGLEVILIRLMLLNGFQQVPIGRSFYIRFEP